MTEQPTSKDDLCDRLRNPYRVGQLELRCEAADEIERLTAPSSNTIAAKVIEVYGSTLQRMRDGTHFEHCWQDHWSCALDMCLEEIVRLTHDLERAMANHVADLNAPKPAHEREPPHCSTCGCPPHVQPPVYLDGLSIESWRTHAKQGWDYAREVEDEYRQRTGHGFGDRPAQPPNDGLAVHLASMCGWAETLASKAGWFRENAASFWSSYDAARAASKQSQAHETNECPHVGCSIAGKHDHEIQGPFEVKP